LRDFQPEFLDSLLTPKIFYPYLAILKGIFKKLCLKRTINAEKTQKGLLAKGLLRRLTSSTRLRVESTIDREHCTLSNLLPEKGDLGEVQAAIAGHFCLYQSAKSDDASIILSGTRRLVLSAAVYSR
jgi:hypothetical protein